jgi:hypothetical protein
MVYSKSSVEFCTRVSALFTKTKTVPVHTHIYFLCTTRVPGTTHANNDFSKLKSLLQYCPVYVVGMIYYCEYKLCAHLFLFTGTTYHSPGSPFFHNLEDA